MPSAQGSESGRLTSRELESRKWTVVLAAVALLVFSWPQTWSSQFVWADSFGEADNHLWMFWAAAQFGIGGMSNAPDGVHIPLMDPINLPPFWLGQTLGGAVWGWRLMIWTNLLVALVGGYGLARELAGPRGAWIGMVGTATAPPLAGFMDFGMTESWTIGWIALHAWMLIALARRGGWWRALAAGLSLGAIAMSGWYHALYGLILEAILVPILWWQSRRISVVLQGGIGFLISLPLWFQLQANRAIWEARWRAPAPGPPGRREPWMDGEGWRELPIFGTDLLNFVLPTVETVRPAKCAYLGLVLILLAGWGVIKNTRVAGAMIGLSVPFLLLALGPWPTVGGQAIGVPGPAYGLVQAFSDLSGMTHWERAVGVAVPFWAVAAAVGASHLPRKPGVQFAVLLCLLMDSIAFSGVEWPRSSYSVQAPAGLAALDGTGGIVQLPFDNHRIEHAHEPARIYTRWQMDHQRMISENYEGIDSVLRESELLQVLDSSCGLRQTIPPYYQVPANLRARVMPEGAALLAAREQLADWGYDWIVLHLDRCPKGGRVKEVMEMRLGAGLRVDDFTVAWEL